MLYIIYWSVGVSLLHASDHLGRCPPSLETLVRHVRCWSFDKWRPLSHTEDSVGTCWTSFRHGLHGTVGMVSYTHVVYVTCYFCYVFLIRICIFTSYYCELVVGLRSQFYTLLEVWEGLELGCWLLTRKRLCTPRIGDSKYRWFWIMITHHIHTNVSLGRMTY
jgi:hypothetical protein